MNSLSETAPFDYSELFGSLRSRQEQYFLEELTQSLTHENFDINYQDHQGKTLLMAAAYEGCDQLVAVLLSNGAQVDLEDELGDTALHYSVLLADEAPGVLCIKILLQHGADLHHVNHKNLTPLWTAVLGQVEQDYQDSEAVFFLIQQGSRVEHQDQKGRTVIDILREYEKTHLDTPFDSHDSLFTYVRAHVEKSGLEKSTPHIQASRKNMRL
jgi:ankyrin repeat protein